MSLRRVILDLESHINTYRVGDTQTLSRPLIEGFAFNASYVVALGVYDPTNNRIVDPNTHDRARDLGEEHLARGMCI